MSTASSYRSCGICFEHYGAKTDDGTTIIPMHLSCCGNHLCFECAEKYRAEEISKLSGNRKKIPCFSCKQLFHSSKDTPWTVGRAHIGLLGIEVDTSAVREAEAARDVSRNSNLPRQQRDITHTETSANNNVAASTSDEMFQPRRSKRRHTQREVETRARKRARGTGADIEASTLSHQSLQDDDTLSSSDLQLTVTVNGERYSEDTVDDMNGYEEADTEFKQIVCKANNLYRVRQFVAATKCKEDPHGRSCSDWAVSKGYCATSDNLLSSAGYPEDPMRYILETDIDTIEKVCPKEGKNIRRYCAGDKTFASMEKGDMVAMNVPGPSGKGEAFFGVITSNELILMSPEKCAKEGFPALDMLGGVYQKGFKGLMLREVKWLRKGYMRELPGQKRGSNGVNTVPWLIESSPFWINKSKKSKGGLNMMKGNEFFKKTQVVSD